MFVKNVRKITVLPNQRMQASSRNRIRKLITKSSIAGARTRLRTVVESAAALEIEAAW